MTKNAPFLVHICNLGPCFNQLNTSSVLEVISNYGGLHLTVTYNVMTLWRADQVHDTRGEIMGHAVMQSP